MADVGKVPGMRKNGEPVPAPDEIEQIPKDQLVDALNAERAAWAAQGLDPAQIQHDHNAQEVQVWTLIHALIDKGILDEDYLNERYQRRMLEKLTNLRKNITQQQITQGVQKPNIILPGR